jgi:hypothetical protein
MRGPWAVFSVGGSRRASGWDLPADPNCRAFAPAKRWNRPSAGLFKLRQAQTSPLRLEGQIGTCFSIVVEVPNLRRPTVPVGRNLHLVPDAIPWRLPANTAVGSMGICESRRRTNLRDLSQLVLRFHDSRSCVLQHRDHGPAERPRNLIRESQGCRHFLEPDFWGVNLIQWSGLRVYQSLGPLADPVLPQGLQPDPLELALKMLSKSRQAARVKYTRETLTGLNDRHHENLIVCDTCFPI